VDSIKDNYLIFRNGALILNTLVNVMFSMSTAFADDRLGLILRSYDLVPNTALETLIAVYTPDVVQTILEEHPKIVDAWLEKVHDEYLKKMRSCQFEQDPIACFDVSLYEEFEKHYKSWQDGGIITICIPQNRTIRLSNKPWFSIHMVENRNSDRHVCEKCLASFAGIDELEKHYQVEHRATSPTEKVKIYAIKSDSDIDEYYAQNPMWW
jgi:hypothetical protein